MRATRIVLTLVGLFVALNAVGGGVYGLGGAPGVTTELLEGSPFGTYFVPSLILLVAVGGGMAAAATLLLGRRLGPWASIAAGVTLAMWIAVQMTVLGFVSWLQPVMLAAALVVVSLATVLATRVVLEAGGQGRAPTSYNVWS